MLEEKKAVMVFEFGCLRPKVNEDIMIDQIIKRKKLWNNLVEIEHAHREIIRELLMISENPINELTQDLTNVRDEIKLRRKVARTGTIDIAELQMHARALKEKIKTLKPEMAKKKRELAESRKEMIEALNKERIQLVKAAQAASGLYWCNYDEVIATYRIARQKVMRAGRELKFHRLDSSGKVHVRFQTGLPVSEAFGDDTRLQIDPVSEEAWISPIRAERRRLSRTTVRLRIGSNGRMPVWLELPMVMHRPLPKAGIIRSASIIREKIGAKYRYRLIIIVAFDLMPNNIAKTGGAVGIDFGWRRVSDGLRVLYWCDENNNHGHLILPDRVVSQFVKINDLRSIRYNHFNDAKNFLLIWLRDKEIPQWLKDKTQYLMLWRSPAQLLRLLKEWHDQRFFGDYEIVVCLEQWLKQDLHLSSWETNLRDQLIRHRREIYRIFAAGLVKKYSYVFMEKFELQQLVRKPNPEEGTKGSMPADSHRIIASISELKRIIETVCKREGVILQYVDASKSTMECHSCGHVEKFESSKQIMRTCPNCKELYDQDYNAAKVILARGLLQFKESL